MDLPKGLKSKKLLLVGAGLVGVILVGFFVMKFMTSGGAEMAQEKPLEATVVSVGPGRINEAGTEIPLRVKAGHRILIGKYAGTEIRIDDIDHVILREDEIIGIVRDE